MISVGRGPGSRTSVDLSRRKSLTSMKDLQDGFIEIDKLLPEDTVINLISFSTGSSPQQSLKSPKNKNSEVNDG